MFRPDIRDGTADNATPLGENPAAATPISPDGWRRIDGADRRPVELDFEVDAEEGQPSSRG